MEQATFYGPAHALVAAAYLGAALGSGAALRQGTALRPVWGRLLMAVAVCGHATLLWLDVYGSGGLRFGFAQDLSATLLLACALLWVEGFFLPLGALDVLVTPLAALAVAGPLVFAGAPLEDSAALRLHLGISVMAYGMLLIAALHSGLMAAMDRHLHQPLRDGSRRLSLLLERMPPLLALERLLFRQILLGFILLSATVASGMAFSEERYGRLLRFNHMTLFALLSWGVFACLLVGRYAFGWRGKLAQRWVMVGFSMLILAYIGTRFVLEVVLGRLPP